MDILKYHRHGNKLIASMSTVYRIDFPDGKVYFGYTAKLLAVRLEEHIESSHVGTPYTRQ